MKGTSMEQAALGFRAHSGWAVLVALGGAAPKPALLVRRRIDIADPAVYGGRFPYHAAAELDLAQAQNYLEGCAAISRSLAEAAVRGTIRELSELGYEVTTSCVLMGSGQGLSDLESTLRSHPRIHTAEGVFFRQALRTGCESCGLRVEPVRERDITETLCRVAGLAQERIFAILVSLGKSVGPPWRQDQRVAALGAWLGLARERP
jgi:hypothetical protein